LEKYLQQRDKGELRASLWVNAKGKYGREDSNTCDNRKRETPNAVIAADEYREKLAGI